MPSIHVSIYSQHDHYHNDALDVHDALCAYAIMHFDCFDTHLHHAAACLPQSEKYLLGTCKVANKLNKLATTLRASR